MLVVEVDVIRNRRSLVLLTLLLTNLNIDVIEKVIGAVP